MSCKKSKLLFLITVTVCLTGFLVFKYVKNLISSDDSNSNIVLISNSEKKNQINESQKKAIEEKVLRSLVTANSANHGLLLILKSVLERNKLAQYHISLSNPYPPNTTGEVDVWFYPCHKYNETCISKIVSYQWEILKIPSFTKRTILVNRDNNEYCKETKNDKSYCDHLLLNQNSVEFKAIVLTENKNSTFLKTCFEENEVPAHIESVRKPALRQLLMSKDISDRPIFAYLDVPDDIYFNFDGRRTSYSQCNREHNYTIAVPITYKNEILKMFDEIKNSNFENLDLDFFSELALKSSEDEVQKEITGKIK